MAIRAKQNKIFRAVVVVVSALVFQLKTDWLTVPVRYPAFVATKTVSLHEKPLERLWRLWASIAAKPFRITRCKLEICLALQGAINALNLAVHN